MILERTTEVDEYIRSFGIEKIVQDILPIVAALENKRHWREKRRLSSGINASSIFGCPRSWYYAQKFISNAPIIPNWKISAIAGDLIHGGLQEAMIKAGEVDRVNGVPMSEVRLDERVLSPKMNSIRKKANISCRIDHQARGEQLEFKTWGGRDFRQLDAIGTDHEADASYALSKLSKHVAQDSLYGYLTEKPRGCIIVINRDNGDVRSYYHKVESKLVEQAIDDAIGATKTINRGEIPASRNEKENCKYCPYWDICDSPFKSKVNNYWQNPAAVPNEDFDFGEEDTIENSLLLRGYIWEGERQLEHI